MKPISDKPYTGDCLATIHDIAETIRARYCGYCGGNSTSDHDSTCCDRQLLDYSIEEIVEIIAAIPPTELPVCVCGERYGLFLCNCGQFKCADCKKDHVHTVGSNDYPFEDA